MPMTGEFIGSSASKRITMTPDDIKNVMMENQNLRKENIELKHKVSVLESTLFSAGIEVDEKFGDNQDHVVLPTNKEVEGYKDVTNDDRAWRK